MKRKDQRDITKGLSFLSTSLALFVAINLTGIGVALFVEANLGSDTITVFIDGLKNMIHTSLGGTSRIYNGLALVIAFCYHGKTLAGAPSCMP